MTFWLRKLNLTAHIAFSVGWIGAAAAFLVLSVVGLTSQNEMVVRGVYVSMNLICLYSIVPLSLASLGTGLIQSLGAQWGLFRHYWVLAKFLLTILSVAVLLMHQFAAMRAAKLALQAAAALPRTQLSTVGFVLLRASGLGILVLLVTTILSVYKPWGLTQYGWLKRQQRRNQRMVVAQTEQAIAAMSIGGATMAKRGLMQGLTMPIAIGIGLVLLGMVIAIHLNGHSFHHGH